MIPNDGLESTPTGKGSGRRVVISSLSGLSSYLAIAIVATVSLRLVTTHLGPTTYGSFITAMTVFTTTAVFTDLGISTLTGREIAKNPGLVEAIVGHNLGLRLFLGALVIPVLSVAGFLVYGNSNRETAIGIVILSICIPFDSVKNVIFGYFMADIRNHFSYIINVVQKLIYLCGIVLVIVLNFGIYQILVAYSISAIAGSAIAFVIARYEIRVWPLFKVERWKPILKQSLSIGSIQVISSLYLQADIIILSLIGTRSEVGLYGLDYVIISLFIVLPAVIMTGFIPLIARADIREISSLVRMSLQWMSLLSVLVCVVTFLFARPMIGILAGLNFDGAVVPLRILAASTVISSLKIALGTACIAQDRQRRLILVSAVGLIANICANVVVIPYFGIIGAAWATFGTELLTVVGMAIVFKKEFGTSSRFVRLTLRPLLAGVASVAAFRVFTQPSSVNVKSAILLSPLLVVFYSLALWLFRGFPDGLVSVILRKLKSAR